MGLGRKRVHVACRLLGSDRGILWRHRLRIRVLGSGFQGGYWRNNQFYYNRSVNNIHGGDFHNVYERNVDRREVSHVSYNGGHGGLSARPTAAQEAAARQHHVEATREQTEHLQAARQDRSQFASVNHGHPAVAATPKPGDFKGNGVVRSSGAPAANNAKTPARPNEAAHNAKTPAHPNETAHPATNTRANVPRPPAKNTPPHNNAATHPNEAKPTSTPHPNNTAANRPKTSEHATATHEVPRPPANNAHKATPTRTETAHPAPKPTESRSTPAPHPTESRSTPARSTPAPRAESRSAPAPHPTESRATPAPRPAPEQHSAPAPHQTESRPASAQHSEPHPTAQRSAPAPHPAPAQHESAPHPSGGEKEPHH